MKAFKFIKKDLEERIRDLEEENASYKKENLALKNEINELKSAKIEENEDNIILRSKIDERQKQIDNLERELDILYQYYELDKEPTQEIKTQVRINKRVYDLELENIRLNTALYSMTNAYTNYLNAQLCNLMTQNQMCNQSIMPMVPYYWR